jgi:hypothetical protein
MICWPVSARVANVKNNDPSFLEPIAMLKDVSLRAGLYSPVAYFF